MQYPEFCPQLFNVYILDAGWTISSLLTQYFWTKVWMLHVPVLRLGKDCKKIGSKKGVLEFRVSNSNFWQCQM